MAVCFPSREGLCSSLCSNLPQLSLWQPTFAIGEQICAAAMCSRGIRFWRVSSRTGAPARRAGLSFPMKG